MGTETYKTISPADFFYRNRDLAGFSNPSRAIYSSVRELVENSLDACEFYNILPDIYLRISAEDELAKPPSAYRIFNMDNGSGVPAKYVPSAFAQVLFGSKYRLRQSRGVFGLGGKMAILYGQITTHLPVKIKTSIGTKFLHEFTLSIDIQNNKPIVHDHEIHSNNKLWRGTIIELVLEGDYTKAKAKILEYLKQTAISSPYANITFVDPDGRLYVFKRATTKMPSPPREIKPHPYGVDIELLQRLIKETDCTTMHSFMTTHFHRVGKSIAESFLKFAGIDSQKIPKDLNTQDIVHLAQSMKNFDKFLPPDATCLSPLGEELLTTGIRKELNPEFVTVVQRKPAAYSGHPFIVEVGIAYGGAVPKSGDILLYRFANRIPLLYDEASDVSSKVIHSMINWRKYYVSQDTPIAVFVHICSTKIPYKTVGKEFISDRPEVEREILGGVREVARRLSLYLSRRKRIEREVKRYDIFKTYLPKIAKFSTELAGKTVEPDLRVLLESFLSSSPKESVKEL